jgi:hypothetical protein
MDGFARSSILHDYQMSGAHYRAHYGALWNFAFNLCRVGHFYDHYGFHYFQEVALNRHF